jgi:hypothetical protein
VREMVINNLDLLNSGSKGQEVIEPARGINCPCCRNYRPPHLFRLISHLVLLACLGPAHAATPPGRAFYAGPAGKPGGNGSWERPWDLATALQDNRQPASRNHSVRPGDTIWLRGGTYHGQFSSYLHGTKDQPVTLRQYPAERATIDGAISTKSTLVIQGAWANYWGFEVMNSHTNRVAARPTGVFSLGPNTRCINLVVHDAGCGIVAGVNATNAEVSGCIIYNNGYQGPAPDRGHGHALYLQGLDGTKRIMGNVAFNQFGYGLHLYTEKGGINRFELESNTFFGNGIISRDGALYPNFFIGGFRPSDWVRAVGNCVYHPPATTTIDDFQIGFAPVTNRILVVSNNYVAGGGVLVRYWTNCTLTDNTFVLGANVQVKNGLGGDYRYVWDRNTYYHLWRPMPFYFWGTNAWNHAQWKAGTGYDANSTASTAMPTGVRTFIVKDQYESDRATIIVYNWDLKEVVNVDVTGLLQVNAPYEVRNVQDLYGAPVLAGRHDGQPLRLPMNGYTVAKPIGCAVAPPPTGPEFNVFLLSRPSTGGAGG